MNLQYKGPNVEYYRKQKGMTQEELAKLLGVVRSNIAQYERGSRSPSIPILIKMADIFGVTVDELVGRVPPDKPN